MQGGSFEEPRLPGASSAVGRRGIDEHVRTVIVLLPVSLLVACAHARSPASEPAGATEAVQTDEREPVEEEGTASYYGDELAGHPMASGAPYRPEAMTCAHRTHRMGARLRVTNLENGRTVVVVVTDRGPFIHGRIVDLSAAAARALDMLVRGVARVRVERL